MSRQRYTEDESGNGGYPYNNEEQQQYPYPSQHPPRQPLPQQYSHQQSKISSSFRPILLQQSSTFDNRSDESYLDEEGTGQSHVDKDGWLFRPPENGHVITKGGIASRIVQYYEMFAVNVFLLGYNVLIHAKSNVDGSTIKNFLIDACGDRFHIEQFDYCAASRLFWGLVGGAIIYVAFTSIVALALSIELRRKGYYSTFTALWHSPAFLLCFFLPEEKRVDILSIPNKYVQLSSWTRGQTQRLSLAIYCAACSILVINSLRKGTAETAIIEGEGLDKGLHRYYNPYLIPYYLALYIFSKTLANMLLTIIQDKNIRNRPERIGRNYVSIK